MLRRFKRFFGLSSRGSYFPNNEVAPADGSIVGNNSSRRSEKGSKKEKKNKKKSSSTVQATVAVESPVPSNANKQQKNEENVQGNVTTSEVSAPAEISITATDSLPYREPSDKSQSFTESATCAPSNVAHSVSSTKSLVGSETIGDQTFQNEVQEAASIKSSKESDFSLEIYYKDQKVTGDFMVVETKGSKEMPVDCGPQKLHSDGSSLCVNMPETPLSFENPLAPTCSKVTSAAETERNSGTSSQPKSEKEEEMDRRMREINDQLNDLLKNPPPFQVSTSRLPSFINDLSAAPILDDSADFSIEEFEGKNNSNVVARMLNESLGNSMKSPENRHLRSFGY